MQEEEEEEEEEEVTTDQLKPTGLSYLHNNRIRAAVHCDVVRLHTIIRHSEAAGRILAVENELAKELQT
eukprot:3994822-Amphidinium_carterae.1